MNDTRRHGWAYHLTTIGSILIMASILTLIAAGIGVLAGQAFQTNPDVVPGRGVTVTPFPPATRPVTAAPTPVVAR